MMFIFNKESMDKVTIAYSSRSRFMGGDYLNHHQAWIDIDPLGT